MTVASSAGSRGAGLLPDAVGAGNANSNEAASISPHARRNNRIASPRSSFAYRRGSAAGVTLLPLGGAGGGLFLGLATDRTSGVATHLDLAEGGRLRIE